MCLYVHLIIVSVQHECFPTGAENTSVILKLSGVSLLDTLKLRPAFTVG